MVRLFSGPWRLFAQQTEPIMHELLSHLDWRGLVLPALIPLFMATLAAEAVRFRGRGYFQLRDTLTSFGIGLLYLLLDSAVIVTLVALVFHWVYAHRLVNLTMGPLSFVALLLLVELGYYVFHRAGHRIRWFWAAHAVHHSSEYMNFTVGMRQSPLYATAGVWLFFLPLSWLGFPPLWVFFMLSLNLGYQYFIHTRWIGKLPPVIEYVFNTPSHHRVHHGRNAPYIDRNYGGMLILYDRLFGTFQEERDDIRTDYGLTRPVHDYNPIRLTLREWIALFRDAARPGPLWLRLKHLWAPPEWRRPDDGG